MFKAFIIIVSLVWASLLLVTWSGGANPGSAAETSPAAAETGR